eukprot:5985956-Pyramimonas_sp.AAC.1
MEIALHAVFTMFCASALAETVLAIGFGYSTNVVSRSSSWDSKIEQSTNEALTNSSVGLLTKCTHTLSSVPLRSWKRPYGVGLLVGGYDATGAHLYYTCPSGNYFEYKAMAMGARSQAAKTYLERKFETFESATLDE